MIAFEDMVNLTSDVVQGGSDRAGDRENDIVKMCQSFLLLCFIVAVDTSQSVDLFFPAGFKDVRVTCR